MSKKNITETNPKFDTIRVNMLNRLEIMKEKDINYNSSFEKTFKEHGLTAVIIRLEDKLNRLKSFSSGNLEMSSAPNQEGLEDTLDDMANYCDLALYEVGRILRASPVCGFKDSQGDKEKSLDIPNSELAKDLQEYSKEELAKILEMIGGKAPTNNKRLSKNKLIDRIYQSAKSEEEIEAGIEKAFKPSAKKGISSKKDEKPSDKLVDAVPADKPTRETRSEKKSEPSATEE